MKRLILLRHAKAVARAVVDDFGRTLAPQGREDMRLVAADIAAARLSPDLVLASPSARTRETLALAGLDGVPARFEPAIYDAELETLLSLICSAPDRVERVMLVGHNPGIEELAAELAAPDSDPAVRRGLPTAALVVLDFAVESWAAIEPGQGRLVHFSTPASLGARG